MDKLALVENDGAATSRLRLLSLGENGAISGQVADRRLTGLPTAAPFIAGRRLVVVTDRGQIEVYDIGERGEDALTPVATRVATGNSPLVRHAVLTKQNIWIGDTQLTKFSILPTGNRLPVEPIENDFVGSVFDHPLAQFGDALVHVRRAKGRAGGIVAATSTAQGKTLWETIVAAPPAGAPVVDESAKSIAVANADGRLFCFDEAAIRTRVQDEPLLAQAAPSPPPALSNSVDLGQGRAAFCAGSSDQLLLYNPALGQAARWIKLDSPLACDVTPLGESIVAPLSIGQVFLLSSADGSKLAAPFQTVLQPQKEWRFKPAAAVDAAAGQFVISDGEQKIYLVTKVNGAQPQLQATSDADTSSPIESPLVVLGDSVIAVAGSSNLVRFQLPSLEAAGDATLPAPVVWGPHRAGDLMLLATANNELMAVAADGKVAWRAPFEHSDLTGAPLPIGENVLIAYRKGVVERRSLVDGKSVAAVDVEQPLATGPVSFIGRLLVVTNDGTLLVVDQP
jgi:outer membrane protein assembly factor BamB